MTQAVGATYAFANGIAPFLELGVSSAVGRGDPDLSIAPTAGVSCTF